MLNKQTKDFKVKIGQIFKDNNRDLTIIDRKYIRDDCKQENQKWYKYHCNKCGYNEGWVVEGNLLGKNGGCSCCHGKTIIKEINSTWKTNPELTNFFVNTEDSYKYSIGSNQKVLMKCNNCEQIKTMKICDLYTRGFSCPQCGDGISYPEKLMFNLLQQLQINFTYQYNKTNNKWCNIYRYDFYFKYNNEEYIIETHGEQHYKECFKFKNSKQTLEEIQQNDSNKLILAINNIKEKNYIIIDCRYSDLDFIKNNILHSQLGQIFDLENIDCIKIGQEAQKSLVKKVCDYWHLYNEINNENLSTIDLGKVFKISNVTIGKYLKQGTKLGWCIYNAKNEQIKKTIKLSKQIVCIELNKKFDSISQCSRFFKDIIKINISRDAIRKSCLKKCKVQGYTFKFI